jgi:mRNA interferase HigB
MVSRRSSIRSPVGVVLNVAGNKYRIVVRINYPYRVVYVRLIGTHRQYDVTQMGPVARALAQRSR